MSHFFKTKADFHEALHQNGIFTPAQDSSISTVKWLDKVYYGEQWCPRYDELRLRPCTRKPVKAMFLSEIQKLLKEQNLQPLIYDEKHTPDVFWCWITLSTLNPNHHFFQKGYIPSDEEKGRKSVSDKRTIISKQEAAFLKDLPQNLLRGNMKKDFSDSEKENDFELPFSSGVKSQRQPNKWKENDQTLGYLNSYTANQNLSDSKKKPSLHEAQLMNPQNTQIQMQEQPQPMFSFTSQVIRSQSKPKINDKDISMQSSQPLDFQPATISKRKGGVNQ